ncbi:hypothetical protein M8C21_029948 [Ambrosia artemisiifolia]|uniref:Uncharacterized protein n=1 Tax=Ambrosia artemisiifolia TaxID=4212 RepID=A0AAD5CE47_AMBAR|nr:hypothetical protein M8C21_029948 [Ambrosia artemisiifolia]
MDTGFRYDRVISFQSGGVKSASENMGMMMGHYYPMNIAAVTRTGYLGTQSGNSCGSVQGLKHDAGLAVEWSVEEQRRLEEGLSKFASEPNIMRYIKIAATLNDKTARDVALRCRWMARKRRKQDNMVVSSSSKPSISSVPTFDVAPFSVAMKNRVQIDSNTFEALSGSIKHLLEQNNQVLGQISANISSMKLQDNLDLFSHTKNNITAILNDMKYMPGPAFPVSINEDLAQNILRPTNQRMTFEPSNGMYMKREQEF